MVPNQPGVWETGILVLCEVATQEMMNIQTRTSIRDIPECDVRFCGKYYPNPEETHILEDGARVPLGSFLESKEFLGQFNQILIPNRDQIRVRFMVRIECATGSIARDLQPALNEAVQRVPCPICNTEVDNVEMNSHIDLCLTKEQKKEVQTKGISCPVCSKEIHPSDEQAVNDHLDLCLAPQDRLPGVWMYKSDNGWKPYGEENNKILEKSFHKRKLAKISISGETYCVNFDDNVQFPQNSPSKRRRVKRTNKH